MKRAKDLVTAVTRAGASWAPSSATRRGPRRLQGEASAKGTRGMVPTAALITPQSSVPEDVVVGRTVTIVPVNPGEPVVQTITVREP
jgi:hypothetical protein